MTSFHPYQPQQRRYFRRLPSAWGATTEEWRAHLGFPRLQNTTETLNATTNMIQSVEAETRDYMRDHLLTRVFAL